MTEAQRSHRPLWLDLLILGLAACIFVTMVALGNWQIERLGWKTDLIERVEARAFQPATDLPTGPVTEDGHEYLRVRGAGVFQHEATLRVKAVTELGPGHWLMVPLISGGQIVWINRGFVPAGLDLSQIVQPVGDVQIEGLLRMSQEGGTLLEENDPNGGRWVSRDVAAMSEANGLKDVLPYFIDVDHTGDPSAWPRGGLTQLKFRNTHLSYALTWYAMALLFLLGMGYVVYDRLRGRDAALED